MDGEISVLRAHVGFVRTVCDAGKRPEPGGASEEAHLVASRRDRDVDAEHPRGVSPKLARMSPPVGGEGLAFESF
jgi:hypothetical protein